MTALDIVILVTAIWLVGKGIIMKTSNFTSSLVFKLIPIGLGAALAILWAHDRGYIINLGG